MNRFNLCFSGEILPGEDPALVRKRFAKLFGIDEPARIEQFFSGATITLRRNLDRKAAGQYYQDMRKIGVVAQLVKISASEAADLLVGPAATGTSTTETQERARQEAQRKADRRQAEQAAREEILRAAHAEQAQGRGDTTKGGARAARRPSARGRVKTRLEVPLRDGARGSASHRARVRKRQPGEPNLYAMRPFRNTLAVRERASRALRRSRVALLGGTFALTLLLILIGAQYGGTDIEPLRSATAIASDGSGGLTLLADNALLRHDRSGTATGTLSAESLGLSRMAPPMLFIDDSTLLVAGRPLPLPEAGPRDANATLQLLRCDLARSRCSPATRAMPHDTALAVAYNRVDNSLFIADSSSGTLSQLGPDGPLLASAELRLAERPVMHLHAGLLMLNSAVAPAISVYRYDRSAFGQQLDEVLLLPPGLDPGQLRVGDFIWNTGSWWVVLYDRTSGDAGVYQFDAEWKFIDQAELSEAREPLRLTAWKDKILVSDGRHAQVARFNPEGAAEAPFVSSLLQERIHQRARMAELVAMGWRGGFALCTLLAAVGLGLAYLERQRERVYRVSRARGAETVTEHLDRLQWVSPAPGRDRALRSFAIILAASLVATCVLAIAQAASAWQLAALLTVFAGPTIGLAIISRQSIGHIGTLDRQLLLTDQHGLYHLGADSRIQYRGAFLLMDDVVVFRGNAILPAFAQSEFRSKVAPLLRGAVKVDRTTLAIKLLQARHPFAMAAAACALAAAACALILVLLSPH